MIESSLSKLKTEILSAVFIFTSVLSIPATAETSVEAHAGLRYDLKIDEVLSLDKVTKKEENPNGSFTGVYISHYTNNFNLNLLATGKNVFTTQPEYEIKSAAISLTPYSTTRSSIQITAGRVIVPFGVYETQRVLPSVILPRTINDSIVGDAIANGTVEPFRDGVIINYLGGNHSVTYAAYVPKDTGFSYRYRDFSRIRTEFVPIPSTNLSAPSLTVDFRNGATGKPSIDEIRTVTIQKKTQFVSYTYENNNWLLDVEYAESSGIGRTKSSNINNTFGVNDKYFYIGAQKTVGKLSILNEYLQIQNSIQNEKTKVNTTNSISLIYDDGKILYLANVGKSKGDIINVTDASAGVTLRVNKNSYVRILGRRVNGTFNARTLGDSRDFCKELTCYAVFDPTYYQNGLNGSIDGGNQTGIAPTTMPVKINSTGIEVRYIWYF